MLDIGFVQQVFLDLALAGRVEDFLFNRGMHHQLGADLFGQGLLHRVALGLFELLEQVLDLAMVGLEQGDGVGFFGLGDHDGVPSKWLNC